MHDGEYTFEDWDEDARPEPVAAERYDGEQRCDYRGCENDADWIVQWENDRGARAKSYCCDSCNHLHALHIEANELDSKELSSRELTCPNCGSDTLDGRGAFMRRFERHRSADGSPGTYVRQFWEQLHCPDCGYEFAALESEVES